MRSGDGYFSERYRGVGEVKSELPLRVQPMSHLKQLGQQSF